MIRHLTAAGFRVQPWANGGGQTLELARDDGPAGMNWRLSVATVAADGPFSRLPAIERVLTVIAGPGFRIRGAGIDLAARPLRPVAFPGDAAVAAQGVAAPSEGFNVMTARRLPRPQVRRARGPLAGGGLVALLALAPTRIGTAMLAPRELLLTDEPVVIEGAGVFAVRLPAG
jgi:hypothetical protein